MKHRFERIRQLRRKKGVTQKYLAGFLGITPNAYQKYEYGTREPDIAALMALAWYFGVSIDYLVGFSDNPEPHPDSRKDPAASWHCDGPRAGGTAFPGTARPYGK